MSVAETHPVSEAISTALQSTAKALSQAIVAVADGHITSDELPGVTAFLAKARADLDYLEQLAIEDTNRQSWTLPKEGD